MTCPENVDPVYFQVPGKSGRAVVVHPSNVHFVLQIIWYRCFALQIDSVQWSRISGPDVFRSHRNPVIFSERPGNPEIGVLRHFRDLSCIPEILDFHFRSQKDCVDVPEIIESVFDIHQTSFVSCRHSMQFCAWSRMSGPDVFRSHRNPVYVPDFLESVFLVLPQLCARSREAATDVRNHADIFRTSRKSWNRCFASLQRSLVHSRNSGIFIFGHRKIVLTFQK